MTDDTTPNLPTTMTVDGLKKQQEALKRLNATPLGEFMKTNALGKIIFGEDQIEVEAGSYWAINPNSLRMGFVTWPHPMQSGDEPLEELSCNPLTDKEISRADCKAFDKSRTSAQASIMLVCMTGEDKGTLVSIKVSNQGGRKSIAKIFDWILTYAASSGLDASVPVVKLKAAEGKTKFGPYTFIEYSPMGIYDASNARKIMSGMDIAKLPTLKK